MDSHEQVPNEFTELLTYLKETHGFDFSGYKSPSLQRRISKRMQDVGTEDYRVYLEYLRDHPEEFTLLFNTILINVTSFFRDPEAWQYLGAEVIPAIVKSKQANAPIRVWSVGCATGEEGYTLAMLLAEAMDEDRLRECVKIFCSDIDEEALVVGRTGAYSDRNTRDIPAPLLEKYFERLGSRYLFTNRLRRSLIFGRFDLLRDSPFGRLDLIVCRNTLMYFNADVQSKIVARFHYALNDVGYLFLGRAEMLVNHADAFTPLSTKWRVFRKVANAALREPVLPIAPQVPQEPNDSGALRQLVLQGGSAPRIVVNAKGVVVMANETARSLLKIAATDVGRLIQDLPVSYRPLELRSHIDKIHSGAGSFSVHDIEWIDVTGQRCTFDVLFEPLIGSNAGAPLGVCITFEDVTRTRHLQEELQRSNQERETALEELQSTNEELETTNEELQSTVEELQTTNEELQSSNEELETMNEELQSTNDELRTTNDELQRVSRIAGQTNIYLNSILASLGGAVIVLGHDFRVQLWNKVAENLWGLRIDEVEAKDFFSLDIGLPVKELEPLIRRCLAGESPREDLVVNAIERRGKSLHCRVTCMPFAESRAERGVVITTEELK